MTTTMAMSAPMTRFHSMDDDDDADDNNNEQPETPRRQEGNKRRVGDDGTKNQRKKAAASSASTTTAAPTPLPPPIQPTQIVPQPTSTIVQDPCLFNHPCSKELYLARALVSAPCLPDFLAVLSPVINHLGKLSQETAGTTGGGSSSTEINSKRIIITLEREEDDGDEKHNRGHLHIRFENAASTQLNATIPVNYIDDDAPFRPINEGDQPPSMIVHAVPFWKQLLRKAKSLIEFCKKQPTQLPVLQINFFSNCVDIDATKILNCGVVATNRAPMTYYENPGIAKLPQSNYQFDPSQLMSIPGVITDDFLVIPIDAATRDFEAFFT